MFRMISAPTRLSAPVRRRPSMLSAKTAGRSLPNFAFFAPFPVLSLSKGCEIPSTENKGFLQAIRVTLVYFRPVPRDAFHPSNLSTLPAPKRLQASTLSISPALKLVHASNLSTLLAPKRFQASISSTLRRHSRPVPARKAEGLLASLNFLNLFHFHAASSTVQRNFAKRGKLFYIQDKALASPEAERPHRKAVPCLSKRRS